MRKHRYPETFNSLIEAFEYFNDEKKAIRYMQHRRWQGTPVCPHCECDKVIHFSDGKRFKCKECHKQFTVTVGTVFENTKIPLRKWFIVLYLVTSHKRGIPAHQVAKHIKVTVKTAWFMLQRLRKLLGCENQAEQQLEGAVMADETFVGGKNKNRHKDKKTTQSYGRSFTDKTPILGLMEFGGKVRTIVIRDTTFATLNPLVKRHIKPGSLFISDEWKGYGGLKELYDHHVVNHAGGRYVDDCGFTTNPIENFWNGIKRMMAGSYNYVKPKYLQLYANEATFRFNTRGMTDGERFAYVLTQNMGSMTYRQMA